MIDMRTLELFYWAAKLGGFGRAAARLNTTQPAVSARIAALEAEYGLRLLERDRGSRATLTREGAALFAQAERMLALAAETGSMLRQGRGMLGLLRLGVSETVVHTFLPRFLRLLHASHPAVTPDVMTDVSANLLAALKAGEVDLALMLGPVTLPGVQERKLRDFPLVFAAKPDLPVTEPLTLYNPAAFPVLSFARNTKPFADLAALLQRAPHQTRLYPIGSIATTLRMAEDGIGIAVVPEAVAAAPVREGRLRLLQSGINLPPLQFSACWLDLGEGLVASAAALAVEAAAET
jgi:DNA-binding transcriptional LysR family regulator